MIPSHKILRQFAAIEELLLLDMIVGEKFLQEQKSLLNINDGFRKIIITGGFSPVYQNDNGFIVMNIYDFLTNLNSLNI